MTSDADMKEANTSKLGEGNFEYFWGCELSSENPAITWSFEEEEDDTDFLLHTLFLKGAVLGPTAVKGERNIVQVETKNYDGDSLSIPLFSLTLGLNDCCFLDSSFAQRIPVTIRLLQGTGPVCISAQHLTEFPADANINESQDELYVTEVNTEDEDEDSPLKKATKRKAAQLKATKSKKGKLDASLEDDEDESMDEDEEDEVEDEDDDGEDEDEDEEEEDSPPKKGAKGRAKKNVKGDKGASNGAKAKKSVKANNGKAVKKGKKAKA